MEINCR